MDLQTRLSRMVPTDMLQDPDFTEILKEKARNTEPSEEESAEKSQPTRLVSPYDRDLVPRLADRVKPPAFGPLVDSRDADHWTHHVVSVAKSWVGVAVIGVLLFFAFVMFQQRRVVSELGMSFAVFAEFPFLGSVVSVFSRCSVEEMRAKIAALDAPPPPSKEETAAQEEQQERARLACINGLVDEALADAHPAQEPPPIKREPKTRAKKSSGKSISL